MPFIVGEGVGPYQIVKEIGRGGMATVFKAYHYALDRYVAIKVMDAAMSKEHDFLERFRREARVIAKLENPHIVQVYDFDEHEGRPYLVLKFIDGYTLRDKMKEAPLTKAEVLEYVNAVGAGLQYAHEHNVLHRDIKPSNVLTSRDGNIYITDFGLARLIEGSSSLTGDMIVGTPHYISPEQALTSEKIDERTDVYSFGVMIFEMVLGRVPYDATTAFTIIEDHIKTPPPMPRSIKPDLPVEVERVILKAIAKRREDRYKSVAELVKAFQQAWNVSAERRTISSSTFEHVQGAAFLIADDGQSFPLAAGRVVLGRNSATKNIQNDIDLTDLDVKKIISRRHAMVQRQHDDYLLYDLDSRNGTFLNGVRVSSREPQKLKPGDVLEFGREGVRLTFVS